ncbi:MAG TPA: PepSY-associated TM helix domain-containing protein [Terriglobia bacterium]|nr:PepSY-associated TM helix domain-containing protein [Terriglobia bacterium]
MTIWREWLEHPEKLWIHRASFQIHFWVGMVATLYMFLMSISGSVIVYRNQLSPRFSVEWLVDLHANLLFGNIGRFVNGIGASSLALLCLTGAVIWWPGINHWRRGLKVNWKAHFGRINWDLHSALGFWCFPFLAVWGISGIYFCFPGFFDALYDVDPEGRIVIPILSWLSDLHFGRFNGFTRVLWAVAGLVPATLSFTGFFLCCRRVIFKKDDKHRNHEA